METLVFRSLNQTVFFSTNMKMRRFPFTKYLLKFSLETLHLSDDLEKGLFGELFKHINTLCLFCCIVLAQEIYRHELCLNEKAE